MLNLTNLHHKMVMMKVICIHIFAEFYFLFIKGGLSAPSEDGEYAWLRARSEVPSSFKLQVREYEGPAITER